MPVLTAPFPYVGGKRRIAPVIWDRFGPDIGVYIEAFAGSCACYLAAPYIPDRVIICDTFGQIANFWRAIRSEPDAVAYWADYPSFHHDLAARHQWLLEWGEANREQLMTDPEWYDTKAAGWWAWGQSLWIGGTYASGLASAGRHDKRPHIYDHPHTGRGVSVQRQTIPKINPMPGGSEVSAQRTAIPHFNVRPGGRGVSAQRLQYTGKIGTGERLLDWFETLAQHYANVYTLNRDWTSAVTPTLLQQTASSPKPNVAILLDPPYRTDTGRKAEYYQSDLDGDSDDAAIASYQWAVANGEQYRIAYCCHAGDFAIPHGWSHVEFSFRTARDGTVDQVMFSPACDRAAEQPLLL